MNSDEQLDDMLADWELARERGEELSVETLCTANPELAAELKKRIERLRATAWMLVDQTSHEALEQAANANTIASSDDTTASEFILSVCESGILTEAQVANLKQYDDETRSAQELAKRLVAGGILTDYQARVILQGGESPLLLDRYIILDAIGSGGMGLVFKALHRSMERIVAIKVLPNHAIDSPEKVKRFQREVKSAGKISHPNVVTAYDAHERNGTYFLVMEYVDGQNLLEFVSDNGTLDEHEAIRIIDCVAAGLEAAHHQGLVHRDVKPTNIMLAKDRSAKLLDLGLARTMQIVAAEVDLTRDGLAMGTASYMSPEQALDAKDADARSDIYSLGCTLYFLLAGKPPFQGRTTVQTIVAHREATPPSLSDQGIASPDVERIYQRMVAKSPADRYESIADLRNDLATTGILGANQNSPKNVPSQRRSSLPVKHSSTASGGKPPVGKRSVGASRRIWLIAAAGVATCIGLIAWWFLNPTPPDLDTVQRDVAKWALNNGGYVTIETDLGLQDLIEAAEIPDGKFQIIGLDLDLHGEDFNSEAALQIPTLESLSLTEAIAVDSDAIGKLKSLKQLDLYSCNIGDNEMRSIGTIKNLDTLTVSDCDMTDDGLALLTTLTGLTYLDVSSTLIGKNGVKLTAAFPNLKTLDLTSTAITGAQLQHLPASLRTLNLAWCEIGDEGVKQLGHLTRLKSLDLQGCNVTSSGIAALATHQRLSYLDLADVPLSPEAITGLQGIPKLNRLFLNGIELTSKHVDAITGLVNLDSLDLSRSTIDEAGLMRLADMDGLVELYLEETALTETALSRFERKRPDCVLYVDVDKI